MSYSQTVGVLYALAKGDAQTKLSALPATFATEEDRLQAEIYEAMQTTALADRPETESDAGKQADAMFRPTAPTPIPSPESPSASADLKSKVVPIKRAARRSTPAVTSREQSERSFRVPQDPSLRSGLVTAPILLFLPHSLVDEASCILCDSTGFVPRPRMRPPVDDRAESGGSSIEATWRLPRDASCQTYPERL